jgi:hypothetical protein
MHKALGSIPSTKKKKKKLVKKLKITGLLEWVKLVEHPPSKHEAQRSNPSTTKKIKKIKKIFFGKRSCN